MPAKTSPNQPAYKLIGQNYITPDLIAKVTGRAKYAEDYRAEGMLFAKLLLSPMPHAHVRSIDAREALAMPGVKAILTVDDLPAPADAMTDLGQVIPANKLGERGLTNDPVYQGEPILAVCAVDEYTCAEAIEKICIDYERLPHAVDPLVTLRPGGEVDDDGERLRIVVGAIDAPVVGRHYLLELRSLARDGFPDRFLYRATVAEDLDAPLRVDFGFGRGSYAELKRGLLHGSSIAPCWTVRT